LIDRLIYLDGETETTGVMKPDLWQFSNEQYAYRMTTMME